MVLVTALSAGLAWSMGSELLFDAWQPHAMILPFWAFLVGAWALSCGDVALAPWLVGVASLLVQTHLSFVFLIAIVGAAAIGGAVVVVAATTARRVGDADRRRRAPAAAGRGVVAAVAWIQPLLDQFFGEGNLAALLRSSSGGDGQRIGLRLGRPAGRLGRRPPPVVGALRVQRARSCRPASSTDGGQLDVAEGDVAGGLAAALGLLVVAAVLAAVIVVGWRRRRRPTVAVGALAAVAVFAAARRDDADPGQPDRDQPPPDALAVAGRRRSSLAPFAFGVGRRPAASWARRRRGASSCSSSLALPTYAAPEGPTADRGLRPSIAALVDQLDEYDPDGAGRVRHQRPALRRALQRTGPRRPRPQRRDVS